jgi:transcriptional regulator with XRE-family HTH domain
VSESVYTLEYRVFLQCLREAREKSGLSQRDLAARLHKSYSYVAKLETGYARMDIYQIRCYLRVVGVPFLEFMEQYEAVLKHSE